MWQPYSKLLELLGRAGVSFGSQETKFTVGRIDGTDFDNGLDWKRYVDSRKLWETWGPVRGSAWEPFHCVTLFAAIDELRRDVGFVTVGPVPAPSLPEFLLASASRPAWAAPGHLVIVDLPGPQSAAVGFQLARMAGYQPVCTFDNWPHRLGVLRTEFVVAALLHYASALYQARERLTAESPPVWICDRERFTGSPASPGRFDNRYIIEDRLLPGPRLLRAQGIRKVIYVTPSPCAPSEDLRNYLDELTPKGIAVATASIATPELWMNEITYVRKFNAPSGWSLATLTLMRSSAGGFGGFVPEPSSGGGGG